MINQYELVLIFTAVIVGVLSAGYFYLSTDIFINLLKRPLQFISTGMFIIAVAVLLSAFISYEASMGISRTLYGFPLPAYFYVMYLVGSVLIAYGARGFTHRTHTKIS